MPTPSAGINPKEVPLKELVILPSPATIASGDMYPYPSTYPPCHVPLDIIILYSSNVYGVVLIPLSPGE